MTTFLKLVLTFVFLVGRWEDSGRLKDGHGGQPSWIGLRSIVFSDPLRQTSKDGGHSVSSHIFGPEFRLSVCHPC